MHGARSGGDRGKWWLTVGALGAGLLTTLAVFAVPIAHGACVPLPPVIGCPPPPSAYGSVPSVQLQGVPAPAINTAIVAGYVLTDSLSTTYYWPYGSGGNLNQQSSQLTIPANLTGAPVETTLTGLHPVTRYTAELVASNANGTVMTAPTAAFTTYEHPRISISPAHRVLTFGNNADIRIGLRGRFDPTKYIQLYAATPPYRRYRMVGERLPTRRGVQTLTLYATTTPGPSPPAPERNFRARVQFDGRRSRSALVYVVPDFQTSLTRDGNGSSPFLTLTATFNVHRRPGRYPRPLVYFYRSSSRFGPYSRFAIKRLKPESESYFGEYLFASARFYSPGVGHTVTCLRSGIFPDMGPPFLNRRCGPPTLSLLR